MNLSCSSLLSDLGSKSPLKMEVLGPNVAKSRNPDVIKLFYGTNSAAPEIPASWMSKGTHNSISHSSFYHPLLIHGAGTYYLCYRRPSHNDIDVSHGPSWRVATSSQSE